MTPQSQQTRELTKTEYELLTGLETEMYRNSNNFPNIEKSELLKAARSLRERGLIKHGKGLWTEDGEMFGSGWCLVYEKQDEISELVDSYEKNSVKKYSESDFAQARQQWKKEVRGEIQELLGRVPNGRGDMIPDLFPSNMSGKWVSKDDILTLPSLTEPKGGA